jgi:hypothetical protein
MELGALPSEFWWAILAIEFFEVMNHVHLLYIHLPSSTNMTVLIHMVQAGASFLSTLQLNQLSWSILK